MCGFMPARLRLSGGLENQLLELRTASNGFSAARRRENPHPLDEIIELFVSEAADNR